MDPSDQHSDHTSQSEQTRLWAPWRMTYVGKEAPPSGCIFCTRLAANNDIGSLILLRGQQAFVIMNLYPYNTGHVMVVPNAHTSDLSTLDDATLTEMALMLPVVSRALRRALNCHGFNIGLNIGAVAGAGVADHLHQHVVPRWAGDANFMPIIAGTTVMPELIPITYVKLRVEIAREATSAGGSRPADISHVIWSASEQEFLAIEADGRWALPRLGTDIDDQMPVWRTAINTLTNDYGQIELLGIATTGLARSDSSFALHYQARPGFQPASGSMIPIAEARTKLSSADLDLIANRFD